MLTVRKSQKVDSGRSAFNGRNVSLERTAEVEEHCIKKASVKLGRHLKKAPGDPGEKDNCYLSKNV